MAWNKGWDWSDENSDIWHPQPVGKKFPNELGLYDMSGNVWEWCSDWYGGYSSSAQTNPKGPFSGKYRVWRGGSWRNYRSDVTVSKRDGAESNEIRDCLGLRLAASWLTEEEKQKFEADEKRFQEEQKKVIDSVFSEKDNMVYIKGGKFIMGRPNSTIERFKSEMPAHRVTLDNFYLCKYEVTQALWGAVMGYNPSKENGDNLAVDNVSWNDCQEFIRKLNEITGNEYRLPTEAEWEYAARGGSKSKGYEYSGSNNIDDVAWLAERPFTVGKKSPNELGLYDMSGNVSEFCSDNWGSYSNQAQTNPQGPSECEDKELRVIRGGYIYNIDECSSRSRKYIKQNTKQGKTGLRLAASWPTKEEKKQQEEQLKKQQEEQKKQQEELKEQYKDFVHEFLEKDNMVYIQGGSFIMGTPNNKNKKYIDESPAHHVTLSNFYLSKHEVTQALWKAVMGYNPSRNKGDNLPVENVSWNDCQEFIRKLNVMTGKEFRLPTEAEWEYAARGGLQSKGYEYSGSKKLDDVAWYKRNSDYNTHPVGMKSPNELGLYDMSGNVSELCSDNWDFYSNDAQINPQGPSKCEYSEEYRVYRGGNLYRDKENCRSRWRGLKKPDESDSFIGLRLAASKL